MMVPSRFFRKFTQLYCIVWKSVPTAGPSSWLAFSGEWKPKDEECNSKSEPRIALEDVNRIVLRTANLIKKFGNRRGD